MLLKKYWRALGDLAILFVASAFLLGCVSLIFGILYEISKLGGE